MKNLRLLLAAGIMLSVTGAALSQPDSPATTPKSRLLGVMGRLVKVDGNNLIVNVRQKPKEVTVATDDKTKFIVDCEPGKLADLKPGMGVGIISGSALRTKPARLMVVAISRRGLGGMIVKIDGRNVVLRLRRRRGSEPKEVTVGTDEETKVFFIGVGGIPVKVGKLEDLKVDMRVTVRPETGTAAKIITATPGRGEQRVMGPHVWGRLVKVDGNKLIINARRIFEEVTVPTDEKTTFSVDFEPGKLADLKPEMHVSIISLPASRTRPARLSVGASSRGMEGTIVKIDGKNVVLRVGRRRPKEVTVKTDEKTKVFFLGVERVPGKVGKVENLKAGMRVKVIPKTGTAAKIIAGIPTRGRDRRGTTPTSRPRQVDGF